MRTTLNIDDDLLAVAKSMADQRHVALGTVVSDLLRAGLKKRASYRIDEGLPCFEVREGAKTITLDDVRSADDEA